MDGENYEEQYAQADALFMKGLVTFSAMPYLIKPGDLLLARLKKDRIQAHVAMAWANYKSWGEPPKKGKIQSRSIGDSNENRGWLWNVKAWSYSYEGTFYKNSTWLEVNLQVENIEYEVNLQDLNILPMRFASKDLWETLDQRGKRFWSCRNRQLVSYLDISDDGMTAVSLALIYLKHSVLRDTDR